MIKVKHLLNITMSTYSPAGDAVRSKSNSSFVNQFSMAKKYKINHTFIKHQILKSKRLNYNHYNITAKKFS